MTATAKNPSEQRGKWSRRQVMSGILLVVVMFLFGLMLGSISPLGSTLRSVIYQSRGEIDLATVQDIYGILRTDFDGELDTTALQNGAKTGLVAATGDQFTNYLTPQATTAMLQRMRGNGFIGIGVELGFKNGKLVIIAPQEGSPAKQAGVQAGDIILAIDGTAVSDMSEEEAVQALRGENGSTVQLTIQRGGEQLNFTVTRRPIVTPSVTSSITDENIGIVTITTFDATTGRLAREAAQTFRSSNVRGIVLDMRDNPGGAVTAAQDVLSLWLPTGSLVMSEKRSGVVLRTYKTETAPVIESVPTVVLMNGGSASASEIVAGALHEVDKATIVGTQSFGKGSVQEVRLLSNGGSLIFTVSRWFTPKNNSIDGHGITPDTVVEATTTDTGRDTQMDAAIAKLR